MKQVNKLSFALLFCAMLTVFITTQSCKKQIGEPSVVPSAPTTPPDHSKTRGWYYMIPQGTFIYYSQLTNGPSNTYRYNGCLAASCLMAAHLYANPIAVNTNTFTVFCSGMGVNQYGAVIGPNNPSAYYYLKNNIFYTQPYNRAQPITAAGRTTTISEIKSYLSMNRSIVARIQYNTNSKIPTTSTGAGNVGHFVLIVGLNESANGIGTVYYYDPYGNPGLKSYSWATFLTAMVSGQVNYYNYMRIGS